MYNTKYKKSITTVPKVDKHAVVKYQTRAGRAKRDEDYTHVEGELSFGPHEQEQAPWSYDVVNYSAIVVTIGIVYQYKY